MVPVNGSLKDSPWWAKTLWVVGPTTAIALWLVYWVTGIVNTNLASIHSNQNMIMSDTFTIKTNQANGHTEMQRVTNSLEEYMRIQNNLTRQLCVNTSATPEERSACFK